MTDTNTPDAVQIGRNAAAEAVGGGGYWPKANIRDGRRDSIVEVRFAILGARAMQDAMAAPEPSGWIVGNGAGDKWRCWDDTGIPTWTRDRNEATRYARRKDAEDVHREDEDVWQVVPYALEPAGAQEGAEPRGCPTPGACSCPAATPAPDADVAGLVEQIAQWLHDEVEYPDPHFPDYHWPEHPDDTGQREDGWLHIVPKDTQAQFRDIARRLATFVDRKTASALTALQEEVARLTRDNRDLQKIADDLGRAVQAHADEEARATAAEAEAAALRAEAFPEALRGHTFVVQHNPNCPSPWLVRLPGKSGRIDLKPYGHTFPPVKHETDDILGFGKTLDDAARAALSAREG